MSKKIDHFLSMTLFLFYLFIFISSRILLWKLAPSPLCITCQIINQCLGKMKKNKSSKVIWRQRADILSSFPAAFHLPLSLSLYLTATHKSFSTRLKVTQNEPVLLFILKLGRSVCGLQEVSSLVSSLVSMERLLKKTSITPRSYNHKVGLMTFCFFWTHSSRHAEALFVLGGCLASCIGRWKQQYSTGQAESILSTR